MKRRERTFASLIGNGLAHIQAGIDEVMDFAFEKLEKSSQNNNEKAQSRFKRALKSGTGFIGTIGKSYYEKYAELKKESQS